ncbi:hypothetical protein PHLGIDRAFT_126910 [Phlebiopsis gigantea 11061_1 CR5-6]|uniref:Arrestin-like N-terminal domain-containing protein n=1 Tax=Phlebiopsis gigantea (strain 11061_1 CR5-6) TaxID=745531 RepID=A0A0C3SC81_PHLG1|nr:hypothetical protein PHLGIDRAFT_126910 [Phlebiopsis gigantea 11061_1 CR5-6]
MGQVEGKMQLQEIAESGAYEVELLKDTVYEWDAGQNIIHPAQTSFRYNLPIHYTHSPTGEQFRLPPSYYADSMSVPGFRVSIKYAIVMHITVAGNKSNWWRKDTLSVRVPFINRDRSQARLVGPFSPIPIKTETGPQTVFKYIIESKEGISQNIDVELYIPNSQVCSVRGPIPFVVTFFAREEILDKYASFHATSGQPFESSHPIDHSDQSGLTNSRQPQHPSVDSTTLPVRMHLLRKTQVDVCATGHASERSTAIWQNKAIATGVVHTVSREYSYAAWSGMINVPEDVLCGGFSAKGIKVTDSLALSIAHPSALRASYYESFFERVPIRLTSECYESDLSK